MPKKRYQPVVNHEESLKTISELVADVCLCGHVSSEHYVDRDLRTTNCSGCACPKFSQAYQVQVLKPPPRLKKPVRGTSKRTSKVRR